MPYNVKSLLKYFAIIIVVVHLVACFWVFTKEFVENPDCLFPDSKVANNTASSIGDSASRFLKGGQSPVVQTFGDEDENPTYHCSWLARVKSEYGPLTDGEIYMLAFEFALQIMCMGYGTVSPTNS